MLRTKRALGALFKLLVSGGLVWWLLSRLGLTAVLQQLAGADPWLLAAALLVFVLSNLLGALQWHLLLRAGEVPMSYAHTAALYHVGLFFNNFLIGQIGGDALRVYDVRRMSGNGPSAFSTVVFDRFVGFMALAALALFASLLNVRQPQTIAAAPWTAGLFLVWTAMLGILFNRKAGAVIGKIAGNLLPRALTTKLQESYQVIYRLRHRPRTLLLLAVIASAVQFLRILTHYCTAAAVGAKAPLLYFIIFIPLVALPASLPISVGGIGVREQSAAVLFATVGLAAPQVVAFEFAAYLVGVLSALPGGLIFALRKSPTTIDEA